MRRARALPPWVPGLASLGLFIGGLALDVYTSVKVVGIVMIALAVIVAPMYGFVRGSYRALLVTSGAWVAGLLSIDATEALTGLEQYGLTAPEDEVGAVVAVPFLPVPLLLVGLGVWIRHKAGRDWARPVTPLDQERT